MALGAAIFALSPGAETVWFHVGRWLTGVQASDSWKPIEIAHARALAGSTTIYDDVFFGGLAKFQYPLTVLLIFGGIGRPSLNVISWLATLVTAVVTGVLLWRSTILRSRQELRPSWWDQAAVVSVGIVATLSFYPVMKAYSLGQVQTCVTALFALMLLAWDCDRRTAAGLALGAMLLVKPGFAPVLLWGAVRREWRFVVAAVGVAAAGSVAALSRFPLSEQLDYLRVLSFIGSRGELFYPNQSINGLLNRWVSGTGSLEWQEIAFPEPHRIVALATTVGLIALIAIVFRAVPRRARGTSLDLSAMALASTIGAPIAWEHHYGVLAPILAVTLPCIVDARPLGAATGTLLFGAALVSANFFQVANRLDGTALNVLQSYLLLAALTIFILLIGTSRTQPVPR